MSRSHSVHCMLVSPARIFSPQPSHQHIFLSVTRFFGWAQILSRSSLPSLPLPLRGFFALSPASPSALTAGFAGLGCAGAALAAAG